MSLGHAVAVVLILANYSVTGEAGGSVVLGVQPCRRVREAVWSCEVYDDSNSGTATYRVRRDGRCWSAVKTASHEEEGRLPATVSGCVQFRDQLRLFDRIGAFARARTW